MPIEGRVRGSTVNVNEVVDDDELLAVRQLHGRRYLEQGFVTHLSESGTIDDPWVEHSVYFAARDNDGRLVGTLRVIHDSAAGLPLLRSMELDEHWRTALVATDPSRMGETGSLATERDPRLVFAASAALSRAAVHHQVRSGFWYILVIVDGRLLRILNDIVGLPFVPVGPVQDYMGPTLPAVLDLRKLVIDLREPADERQRFMADGLPPLGGGEVIDLRDVAPPATRPAPGRSSQLGRTG